MKPQFRVCALAVIALVVSPGCGGSPRASVSPGSVFPPYDAGPAPRVGVPQFLDPQTGERLSDSQFLLEFGRVRRGDEKWLKVYIRNDGTAPLTVAEISPLGTFPPCFSYPREPLVLAEGAKASLAISFRDEEAGERNAVLQLRIENGDPDYLTIWLHATSYGNPSPEVAVEPASLSFGRVAVDTYQMRRLTVMNIGIDRPDTTDDNLRFGAFDANRVWTDEPPKVVGPDAADFSIEWPPYGYSASGLADNEQLDVRVNFAPSVKGVKAATLLLYTNDPARRRVEVPIAGEAISFAPCDFSVEPASSVDFGICESNKYLTRSFAIRNKGTDPDNECLLSLLNVTAATADANAFALVNGPIQSAVIKAGESLDVPVRFQPKSDGTYTGEVAFYVSNPTTPEVRVALKGIAHGACLMVAPRELDFGTISVRCRSRDRVFTIYNTCSSPVVIASLELLQAGTDFTFSKQPALPVTVTAGGSVEVRVVYRPSAATSSSATLRIAAAPVSEWTPTPIDVPLLGNGGVDPPQTDTFTNSPPPELDVLFVIDNSATMANKQATLSTALDSFVNRIDRQCWDYHLAVTTTDVGPSGETGRFVPLTGSGARVITRQTPGRITAFTQLAAVGTAGSETESLLRPAYLALTEPLKSGHNAGFYRSTAQLVVVIISDAADQDPLAQPTSFYQTFLTGLKTRAYDVAVGAAIPLASSAAAGCSYDTASAGTDTRVRDLVQQMSGLTADICSPSWPDILRWSDGCWSSRRTSYFLSNNPDMTVSPDPILVTLNGQPYGPYDASGNTLWEYNAASNAVEFSSDQLYGTLAISYYVACLH